MTPTDLKAKLAGLIDAGRFSDVAQLLRDGLVDCDTRSNEPLREMGIGSDAPDEIRIPASNNETQRAGRALNKLLSNLCKEQPTGTSYACAALAEQEGETDFQTLARGLEVAKPVVRVHRRAAKRAGAFGTGILIGEGLLLTGYDTLRSRREVGRTRIRANHTAPEGMVSTGSHDFALTPDIFLSSQALGITLVSVAPVSRQGMHLRDLGWVQIKEAVADASRGAFLHGVHHAGGDVKKFGLRGNIVIGRDGPYLYGVRRAEFSGSGVPLFDETWDLVAIQNLAVSAGSQPDGINAIRATCVQDIREFILRAARKRDRDAQAALRCIEGTPEPGQNAMRKHKDRMWRLEDFLTEQALGDPKSENATNAPHVFKTSGAARPVSGSDASWPLRPENAPDTWHLPAEHAQARFDVTGPLLRDIASTSLFPVASAGAGNILFALRGAAFLHAEDQGVRARSLQLRAIRPRHDQATCIFGIWHKDTNEVTAFAGTTLPSSNAMKRFYDHANFEAPWADEYLLPTGCYRFQARAGCLKLCPTSKRPHTAPAAVIYGVDHLVHDVKSPWALARQSPVIRAARGGSLALENDRSCATSVSSDVTRHWDAFSAAAGSSGVDAQKGFDLMLITGHEAAAFAHAGTATERSQLRCLRQGSYGRDVGQLQVDIGAHADGEFDALTAKRLADHQARVLGFATGSLSRSMQDKLGFLPRRVMTP